MKSGAAVLINSGTLDNTGVADIGSMYSTSVGFMLRK